MKKMIPRMLLILVLAGMLVLAFGSQQAISPTPPETEWTETFGGSSEDVGWSVVQTGDGGYTVAGSTQSSGVGGWDFWLVKVNSAGGMDWSQTYGGTDLDFAYSLVETSDGGYAIAGETWSFGAGNGDFWLVKTDANGNMQWNQTYGGTNADFAHSMIVTGDGGFAIAGGTQSSGEGGKDFWLVKTDSAGNMQWARTYGGVRDDYAYSVVQTGDGGYILAGGTQSYGTGGLDYWLVKTDANGNMQWNQTYGGTSDDSAYSVVETDDGGYAVAGYTRSLGAGSADFWLVRTDSSGNMLWSKTYGGADYDRVLSMVQTGDGGYAMAGETGSFGAGEKDFWLVKTGSNGNMEWNKTYGGIGRDKASSVVQTADGGYCVTGETLSFGAGGGDLWLIKLAPTKIPATVDIDPDTLNEKSNGQWITAYITLPEGHNVEDINSETVKIEGIPAAWSEIQDSVFMAKFDRATVRETLTGMIDYEEGVKFYDLELTVTGEVAGTSFEGTDTIVVVWK